MASVVKVRDRALEAVDAMPPALRRCVHEFGYPAVAVCLQMGVNDPARIGQLVSTILAGARSVAQKSDPGQLMQWLELQTDGTVPPVTTRALCLRSGWLFMPGCASRGMIEASMNEVSGGNERMTKREKHRRRLNAALLVAREEMKNRRTFPSDKGAV